jgi:hypothetical protein
MKIAICIIYLIFCTGLVAQKNYTIEYDKLADKVTYYRHDWAHGAMVSTPVKSIRLEQNDVVTIKALNMNPFVFSAEFYQEEIEKEESISPVTLILSQITRGAGGPALQLLTGLAQGPPTSISTRGGSDSETALKLKYTSLLSSVREQMSLILNAHASYNKAVAVKKDKSLTRNEILQQLKTAQADVSDADIEDSFAQLKLALDQLYELSEQEPLATDDMLWGEIDLLQFSYNNFMTHFVDEEGNVKAVNIKKDIYEVEQESFEEAHTFIARSTSQYGEALGSNDFILLFKEKQDNVDIDAPMPVDHVKIISVPVESPNVPYWGLGIDAVFTLGGVSTFAVSEIEGDYWNDLPDSLRITETLSRTQLAIGTKLMYDFRSQREVQPAALFGVGLSGINKPQEDWMLNLLVGGGISFRSFPWVGINGGLSFTQVKVLKDEYLLNTQFVKPDDADAFNGYETLFRKQFKPGLFLGVSLKF